MKRQYMMPAMQELDVTLKTAIMSENKTQEGDPNDPFQAPVRKLYI